MTPEQAIAFTRICVAMTWCWPPPKTAPYSQVLLFKVIRCIMIVNGFLLFLPLLYALYVHRNSFLRFAASACLTLSLIQLLSCSLLCAIHYERFQLVIDDMTLFISKATEQQRTVLQHYVDKYARFYAVSASWFYITAASFVMGAVFSTQPLPAPAEYPFAVDYEPLRSIIFVQQSIVAMQCGARVCITVFSALLILFSAARFDVLIQELSAVKSDAELIECWEKYYTVRRYAQEVVKAIKFISLITVLSRGTVLVFCGILWIGDQPMNIKIECILLTGAALLEVFMCALPADKLKDISESVTEGIYDCEWYNQPLQMQKTVMYMLLPLKPVVISIQCVIPALTTNYFSAFISNVFSFFTALRVIVNDEK